jgi:hypothetical protein
MRVLCVLCVRVVRPCVLVQPPAVTAAQAFQHYGALYVKYLQIFRRLETAYDNMVHPQKRLDVKVVLEMVQARVLELKHSLVRWCPRNPDVAPPDTKLPPFPFPWEYVNLDDILVDLKLPPYLLEVPIPRYYTEDRQEEIKNRSKVDTRPSLSLSLCTTPHSDLPVLSTLLPTHALAHLHARAPTIAASSSLPLPHDGD